MQKDTDYKKCALGKRFREEVVGFCLCCRENPLGENPYLCTTCTCLYEKNANINCLFCLRCFEAAPESREKLCGKCLKEIGSSFSVERKGICALCRRFPVTNRNGCCDACWRREIAVVAGPGVMPCRKCRANPVMTEEDVLCEGCIRDVLDSAHKGCFYICISCGMNVTQGYCICRQCVDRVVAGRQLICVRCGAPRITGICRECAERYKRENPNIPNFVIDQLLTDLIDGFSKIFS